MYIFALSFTLKKGVLKRKGNQGRDFSAYHRNEKRKDKRRKQIFTKCILIFFFFPLSFISFFFLHLSLFSLFTLSLLWLLLWLGMAVPSGTPSAASA